MTLALVLPITMNSNSSLTTAVRSTSQKLIEFTKLLPARTDLHLARKAWHIIMGLAIVSCYLAGMSQETALGILTPFFLWSITMEYLRLKNPSINEKCVKYFSLVIRSHEINQISGVPFYIASCIFAIAIFPKPVAILSMFYLVFGDPIASLVGILYSNRSIKIFNGTKSLHGTAAGFSVCALITWIYLQYTGMQGLDVIRLSLLGGFAGSLAELVPLEVDDNFSIPVISGFIMWAGFIAMQFV